ncbi:antitoxin VapB family protein [Halorussus sp. AFM4]|uniref:antitoxin VapB family protein n=1 Tax=Halorussus sp. AFM4 TaxID=3421651 RepID=UPI003EB92AA6
MGTDYKSVRLTEEAYETLEKRKREDETFSETVERLARERPISDLAGLFADDDIEAIRTARTRSYETYTERREQEWDE